MTYLYTFPSSRAPITKEFETQLAALQYWARLMEDSVLTCNGRQIYPLILSKA